MAEPIETTVAELMGMILSRDPQEMAPGFALRRENRVEPLDVAKLAMAMEEHWNVRIFDEEIAEWRSLRDASACMRQMLEDGWDQPEQRSEEERTAWFYE